MEKGSLLPIISKFWYFKKALITRDQSAEND
jgi:hypothetical protein